MDTKETIVDAQTLASNFTAFELTEGQTAAVAGMSLSKPYSAESIARAAFSARLKSDYKRFVEGAQKETEKLYDSASMRGAKWSVSKKQFVDEYMSEANSILNRL